MARLQVSYAGHLSDRVQPLYDGSVAPEGIDLHFLPLSPVQAFNRMLRGEFDCSEMSFATYVIKMGQAKAAERDMPFVAIPVFPSRTYRHGAIYVNLKAGIREPRDLIGRTVGVPEYQMTAAVWARGLLMHEYGVTPESIDWVTGGLTGPGRSPLVAAAIKGVKLRHEAEKGLFALLSAGDIEALIAPQVPPGLRSADSGVARLFPDFPEVERAYFRKTGLFPIMHVVVLRRDLYERHPWAAVSLYDAFETAKVLGMQGLEAEEPLPISLPWINHFAAGVRDLMGSDYWPYGIARNQKEIAAMCDYTWEQGLVPERVAPEHLFAPNVVAAAAIRL